jgi:hypothetical protein
MCMGCHIRDHVRAKDDGRRARSARAHHALNAALAAEGIPELPPESFAQLRRDLERLPGLRAAIAPERRRRRDVLRVASDLRRQAGCTRDRIQRAA